MDDELNQWKALYAQQRTTGIQTTVELGRVRARDRWNLFAELAAGAVILAAGVAYLASHSALGMFVGAVLMLFAVAGGLHYWRSMSSLKQAVFASPAEYTRELIERNVRETRRLTPLWGFAAAIGLALLIDVELLFGSHPVSATLAAVVITAEGTALLAAIVWRRRVLARLHAEKAVLAELNQ